MKKKFDREKLRNFYMEIWKERQVSGRNYSDISGSLLPREPSSLFFDHLLEKAQYPDLIFEKRNIVLVTAEEHEIKTLGFPKPRHKELVELAKKELL